MVTFLLKNHYNHNNLWLSVVRFSECRKKIYLPAYHTLSESQFWTGQEHLNSGYYFYFFVTFFSNRTTMKLFDKKKMLEPPVFYIPLYWLIFYHFPFLSQSTFLLLASQGRLYKVRNNTTTLLQTFLILKFRNTHTILWMPFSTSKCDVHSTPCW